MNAYLKSYLLRLVRIGSWLLLIVSSLFTDLRKSVVSNDDSYWQKLGNAPSISALTKMECYLKQNEIDFCWPLSFGLGIVIRGDWLWKAANINDKNNSAAVYVQSTGKVHNPLFSVGKLLRNKLMQRFCWSIQSKW